MPVSDDVAADILRRRTLRLQAMAFPHRRPRASPPDLLPHKEHGHGVVINYIDHYRPHLFSRPQSGSGGGDIEIDGNLISEIEIEDEDEDYVVHPGPLRATASSAPPLRRRVGEPRASASTTLRRGGGWATLPESSSSSANNEASVYLPFDPAVSLHYEVLSIPSLPNESTRYKVEVFSSRTGRWEEREFVREEEDDRIRSK
uniref:Uncharacterized protein n=1 Tax=Leersia perrieri TaxID=77586 RepID=A0A0D9XUF3_9ORYZ